LISRNAFAGTAILTVLVSAYFVIVHVRNAMSDDGLTSVFGTLWVGVGAVALAFAAWALVAALRSRTGGRDLPAVAAGVVLTLYFTWLGVVGLRLLLVAAAIWGIATVAMWLEARPRHNAG
jgi:hypothetical protein